MPPTPASRETTESASNQTTPQRNDRPYLGDKEPKFVIKIQTPVPG
jgi:hypothetical protein